LPWSGEEDGNGRQVVVTVSPNKQLNHRSVLEEPVRSSSLPSINRDGMNPGMLGLK
jgi:hypothetical protein